MPRFMVEAAAEVERRCPGTRVVPFGHLGYGNVHFNVRAPTDAAAGWIENEGLAVTAFVHDLVTAAGGSISAEHGIGQMRLSELARLGDPARLAARSAEHTSELQSLMRISYAVVCLKKKNTHSTINY